MKFMPKEDFKEGFVTFEEGNTYNSEKHGISDETVEGWYGAGWTEIEGRDPAPERDIRAVNVKPHRASHAVESEKVSG